jgi:hypothetical protein
MDQGARAVVLGSRLKFRGSRFEARGPHHKGYTPTVLNVAVDPASTMDKYGKETPWLCGGNAAVNGAVSAVVTEAVRQTTVQLSASQHSEIGTIFVTTTLGYSLHH